MRGKRRNTLFPFYFHFSTKEMSKCNFRDSRSVFFTNARGRNN